QTARAERLTGRDTTSRRELSTPSGSRRRLAPFLPDTDRSTRPGDPTSACRRWRCASPPSHPWASHPLRRSVTRLFSLTRVVGRLGMFSVRPPPPSGGYRTRVATRPDRAGRRASQSHAHGKSLSRGLAEPPSLPLRRAPVVRSPAFLSTARAPAPTWRRTPRPSGLPRRRMLGRSARHARGPGRDRPGDSTGRASRSSPRSSRWRRAGRGHDGWDFVQGRSRTWSRWAFSRIGDRLEPCRNPRPVSVSATIAIKPRMSGAGIRIRTMSSRRRWGTWLLTAAQRSLSCSPVESGYGRIGLHA
ncbi:MAG: hypothetical protein JWN86_4336, partial [Planctomycetota bacterium]|nr:hypothetical protein [Planctomycetota bacterium]